MGYQWPTFLMLTIGSAGILGMFALLARQLVRVLRLRTNRLVTTLFAAVLVLVWSAFTIAAAISMGRSG